MSRVSVSFNSDLSIIHWALDRLADEAARAVQEGQIIATTGERLKACVVSGLPHLVAMRISKTSDSRPDHIEPVLHVEPSGLLLILLAALAGGHADEIVAATIEIEKAVASGQAEAQA